MDEDYKTEKDLVFKISVSHQYRRSKKISYIVRERIVKVRNSNREDVISSEATILTK